MLQNLISRKNIFLAKHYKNSEKMGGLQIGSPVASGKVQLGLKSYAVAFLTL